MKLQVTVAGCCGHARCATIAPDIFILNEIGYLDTSEIEVPPGEEAVARRAARACPEQVIAVAEGDE